MSLDRLKLEAAWNISRFHGMSECPMGEILALRRLCWPGIYAAGESLEDGFDEDAWHWIVRSGSHLIAAARLTIHYNLIQIPEAHLFNHLVSFPLPTPIGYISRLVVHPDARRHGLAGNLDRRRLETCRELSVKWVIANWTTQSGARRKQQLINLGFQSPDGGAAHPDGAFGNSFVYWMPSPSVPLDDQPEPYLTGITPPKE